MATSLTYNIDCMEYMKTLPDKSFDLAVVDPPYGDGLQERERERERERLEPLRPTLRPIQAPDRLHSSGRNHYYCGGAGRHGQGKNVRKPDGTWGYANWRDLGGEVCKKIISWDVAPGKEYFEELFRVSRNQIIWGGNYFALPPTRCFLIWRKLTISESFSMAMAEYAWTSFNENAKVFEYAPQGRPGDDRFHPTQKPVALYKWLLSKYAKPGDKILDTHLGSGSSRIAAWDLGFDFVGCEIDKVYFDLEEKRFEEHTKQQRFDLT